MFKQLSTSLLIASACILSSCTPTVKQEIAILPTPVSLTEQSGAFVLKDGMKIGVSGSMQEEIHFGDCCIHHIFFLTEYTTTT